MNLSDELELSYYKPVANINDKKHVQLVQHTQTGEFFVRKELSVYNLELFESLKADPIDNIPRIYALVEDEGHLIVIEEYLHGESLQKILDERGAFTSGEALWLIRQLCAIVSSLHTHIPPIIHRDIKPSNIILSPDGILKLLDLNAAKYFNDKSRDTVLLGTAGFAAPEQYGFGSSLPQTDIYASGVVFNVLLTGHIPSEEITGGVFAPIISKCTKLDPEDRYADVNSLLSDLNSTADLYNIAESPYKKVVSSNTANEDHPSFDYAQSADSAYTYEQQTSTLSQSNPFEESISTPSLAHFTPPGFRTKNPVHMAIAVFGYLMIFYIGFTLETENATGLVLLWDRISETVSLLAVVLFSANYLNVQSHFPFLKNKSGLIRIIIIALFDCVIFVAVAFFMILLEAIALQIF